MRKQYFWGQQKEKIPNPKIKLIKRKKTFSYKISTLYFSSPKITTGISVLSEASIAVLVEETPSPISSVMLAEHDVNLTFVPTPFLALL